MLVRHDLWQLRKHFVRRTEREQERLSRSLRHRRNKRRGRIRIELAAKGLVVRQPLGKSDQLAHLPVQSQRETPHAYLLGCGDGIGVKTLPEDRVTLELPPERGQIVIRQNAEVRRNPLGLGKPAMGSRTKQLQEAHESINAISVHRHTHRTRTHP